MRRISLLSCSSTPSAHRPPDGWESWTKEIQAASPILFREFHNPPTILDLRDLRHDEAASSPLRFSSPTCEINRCAALALPASPFAWRDARRRGADFGRDRAM